jgi:membrane protein
MALLFHPCGMDKALQQNKRPLLLMVLPLLKRALTKLLRNDPLRMAGATAFFTSFALPFILIILSNLLGLFYSEPKVSSELFQTLSDVFGVEAMDQVIEILLAFRQLASSPAVTIAGILFLFLVSTTLLMVIKSSINQLWRIKVVHGRGLLQKLRTRLQSILIIAGTGILFSLSILAEGLKAHLDSKVTSVLPAFAHYFVSVSNYAFSLIFVTLWFTIIFRMLPDAKAPWKIAMTGAFITSVLFNLGKVLLRLLLVNSNLNTLYGASASIVLLLLFVFYSSLILYFGASFTHVWADWTHTTIRPRSYATHYRLEDIEEEAETGN